MHPWKHQQNLLDRSTRPYTLHDALSDQQEQIVLWLRRTRELPFDELLEAAQAMLPHLSLRRLQGCGL